MLGNIMILSQRTKLKLFILLIVLNFLLRYPTTPHELGHDSFIVHSMANSVSEFGYAKWWLHPASIIGSYPYAITPSSVPFLLSGISQSSTIDMEVTIFIYSMILGLFSIFSAYLVAGKIWNDDLYKFLVAFLYSTSQGILAFTTWTAHSRTLLILLLPIFIYLLLYTRSFKVRFSILTFIIFVLLVTTHKLFYFTIPFIIGYFAILISYNLKKYFRYNKKLINITLLIGMAIMFIYPFFSRTLMESDPLMIRDAAGRYIWLSYIIVQNTRYIGILIIFALVGYFYLLLKHNKSFEEWFLLISLIGFAPLIYIVTYSKWFLLVFAFLLIGISLRNIIDIPTQKKKIAINLLSILILISIFFTGYYQFVNFLKDPGYDRYMDEITYDGALWIKDFIGKDHKMAGPEFTSLQVLAISETPILSGTLSPDFAYGFVDKEKLEITAGYSPLEIGFYMRDPYSLVNQYDTSSLFLRLLNSNVDSPGGITLSSQFNLSYYLDDKSRRPKFAISIEKSRDKLFDNGRIRVWRL